MLSCVNTSQAETNNMLQLRNERSFVLCISSIKCSCVRCQVTYFDVDIISIISASYNICTIQRSVHYSAAIGYFQKIMMQAYITDALITILIQYIGIYLFVIYIHSRVDAKPVTCVPVTKKKCTSPPNSCSWCRKFFEPPTQSRHHLRDDFEGAPSSQMAEPHAEIHGIDLS